MSHDTLFDNGTHRNIFLEECSGSDFSVQANQHLIIDGDRGMILDPGGHKIYSKVIAATAGLLGKAKLETIFLSHQDPDIVAAINGWLMTTDATAYVSELWTRFVPHFGLDRLVQHRLKGIPDEGQKLTLGSCELLLLPAHFLHSPGNFQVYDPVSKILYSGDLGASVGITYRTVTDFAAHLPSMEGFHRRYMASGRALRAWAKMVRTLDIQAIAPQHGAIFQGPEMVANFIDWAESLTCGVDLIESFHVPS